MKNCTGCAYAVWETTKAGKRHPSGDGICGYEVKLPSLPASMHWSAVGVSPKPLGGRINRRRKLSRDCGFFQWRKT